MERDYLQKSEISFWGVAVIIYVLLSPLEVFLIGQAGSILKYYALGCIILFVIKIIHRTKIRLFSVAQASLFLFFIIAFFTAFMSPYSARGMDVAQSIGLQVIFILTATQIDYTEKEKTFFLLAYIMGCLILSGFVFSNIDLLKEGLRASASTSQTTVDPNNVAAFLVSAVALLQRFKFQNPLIEGGKYIGEVVLVIATLMTASRGAVVALLIIVLYYILSQENVKSSIKKMFLIMFILYIVICISNHIFGSNSPIDILINRFVNDTTGGSYRLQLWSNAIEAIGDKPFWGYGLGASPYIVSSGNLGSHNTFFTIWLEMGILGLIFLLTFYFACWKNRKENSFDKAVFDMLLITIVTSSFFDAYNKKIFWIPILLCMISIANQSFLTDQKSEG